MTMYYDPEYDRIVGEDVIKRQYEDFNKQDWFSKSYEQFKEDNFSRIPEGRYMVEFSFCTEDGAQKTDYLCNNGVGFNEEDAEYVFEQLVERGHTNCVIRRLW